MTLRTMTKKLSRLEGLLRRQNDRNTAAERLQSRGGPLVQWAPFPDKDGRPSPQRLAYDSLADELFFGGSAGGGKTDLLIGLALTAHRHSILFRRLYTETVDMLRRTRTILGEQGRVTASSSLCARTNDGRIVDFGAVQHEEDMERFRGRPHDLIGFDELPLFTRAQYQFLIGWNRNAEYPRQRCRVVCTGNPPLRAQDRWVIKEWAPWLDEKFPDPAEPGELRWYTVLDGKMVWLKPGVPLRLENDKGSVQEIVLGVDAARGEARPFPFRTTDGREELITPRSRTFIPACVDDNPILLAAGYKAVLQAKPEPLRSQLLYGDFKIGLQDDAWQLIPTAWVRAAQERWTATTRRDVHGNPLPPEGQALTCIGVDVAHGGADCTAVAPRYGVWFAPIKVYQGKDTDSGEKAALLVMREMPVGSDAPVNVDAIGWGSECHAELKKLIGKRANAINVATAPDPPQFDRTKKYKLTNLRAAMYWKLREALDPVNGDGLMLPPDAELLADLTAARFEVRASGIIVEPKVKIKERLGRSPDLADAVALAHYTVKLWKLKADWVGW